MSDWIAAGGTLPQLLGLASETPAWGSSVTPQGPTLGPRGKTARELCTACPPEGQWAWPGYLAYGAVTELAGPIKQGNITFVLYGIRILVTGEPFLGHATTPDRVVLVSVANVLVRTCAAE